MPKNTSIDAETAAKVVALLSKDYYGNIKRLLLDRRCWRRVVTISGSIGNTVLYIGSGLSTAAGAITIIGNQATSNLVLFSSIAFYALHIVLVGMSKGAGREEKLTDELLIVLADQVGFAVTPLLNDTDFVIEIEDEMKDSRAIPR